MNASRPPDAIPRSAFLRALALCLPWVPAAALGAEEPPREISETKVDLGNLRAFVELARSDLRTQKALILAQNLDLTVDEAVEFWPLHREYTTELNRLLDQRYDLFVKFVKEYGAMTNEQATDLSTRGFGLEQKRLNLKRKYFKKFRKVIPALKAAQVLQIENQLNMAMDLQLAASLPLLK